MVISISLVDTSSAFTPQPLSYCQSFGPIWAFEDSSLKIRLCGTGMINSLTRASNFAVVFIYSYIIVGITNGRLGVCEYTD